MISEKATRPVADLPLIDEVAPRTGEDEECLQELREVLIRHGKAERFGISLLHRHFDLGEGEVLVETCDPESRTLVIQPIKEDCLEGAALVETNWRMDIRKPAMRCLQYCLPGPGGAHIHQHQHIRV